MLDDGFLLVGGWCSGHVYLSLPQNVTLLALDIQGQKGQ
jgi:hypothetical protein